MSRTSKAFLGTSCLVTISIIGYVHWKQNYDREQLHIGVIRDIERQQRRKAENLFRLGQQIDITKEYQRNNPNVIKELGKT
ncbi:protein PET117 homolog, mitochondrial [Venturia canescens]|uniref:protein PET117 homolog, mitochondrial n=1 Tax=Venturia canescens TaxID=32260 RepID=UPI001C9C6EA5|nr:protein PET117 homolog, mitochondrial [Venturia canescens]